MSDTSSTTQMQIIGRDLPAWFDEVADARVPDHPIDPIFVSRWSPRAMTGERLPRATWLPLFEAARWAPSSFNSQFWRFVISERDDARWDAFLDLLMPGNQAWAARASLLCVILGRRTHEKKDRESRTYAFSCGSAFQNLALEGARRGLVVHGMEGFDFDKAAEVVGADDAHDVLAMFAVGPRAEKDVLEEKQQAREKPNGRHPVGTIVHVGRLGKPLDGA